MANLSITAFSVGKPLQPVSAQDFAGGKPLTAIPQDTPTPQDTSSENTKGVLGKISSFIGTDKLGIGLGKAINNATGAPDELLALSQKHRETTQQLANLLNKPTTSQAQKDQIKTILNSNNDYAANAYNDVSTGNLTNKEVLGSAAQTALTIGTAGSFNPGAATGILAKEAAPALIKPGFTAIAKRIAGNAGVNALQGAAVGTAQGLTEDKSIGDSLKQGAVTGAVGGVLGGGLAAGGEVVRGLTGKQLVESLYNSALGVDKKTIQSGRSPAADLIKRGVVGTSQQIYSKAQSTIDAVEPKISQILQKSDAHVSTEGVMANLAHQINESVGNTGTDKITSTEMRRIIGESLPQVRTLLSKDDLQLADVNKLRQVMDRTLGDRAFTGATLPFKKDALYDASNALRALVKKSEPTTVPLFNQYANAVQTTKALDNEMSKPHNLRHMLSILAAVGGGPLGAGAAALNEGAQTTFAKSVAAVGLSKIGEKQALFDKSAKAALISRLTKAGLIRTVSKISSSL